MLLTIHQFITYTSISLISQFSVKNKNKMTHFYCLQKLSFLLSFNRMGEVRDQRWPSHSELGDVKNQGCLLREALASSPWTQKTSGVGDGRKRWWQKWHQRRAAMAGVHAISEQRRLLWRQQWLWQKGDCSNGDKKRRQRWRQEMVVAMAAATAAAMGSDGGSNCGREGQQRWQQGTATAAVTGSNGSNDSISKGQRRRQRWGQRWRQQCWQQWG